MFATLQVVLPTYAMQNDPKYYPDPEVFDPERFSEEALKSRHPCTWVPFGAGPRICAGVYFYFCPKIYVFTIISIYV